MLVTAVNGIALVTVVRGFNGTQAVAHNNTSGIIFGLVTDFPNFNPTVGTFNVGLHRYQGPNAPVAAATTITAPGEVFHITGTTATATINLPSNFVEGHIFVIADGILDLD